MDVQSLPQYRGLPDSPKGWGEQDEQGNTPRMRLRDYVVLSLILLLCFPINSCLVVHFWACHRKAEAVNSVREKDLGP